MDTLRAKTYSLLRLSERFFKTDMVHLTKGGFWLSINQAVLTLLGFLSAVIFARFLPQEVYGNFKYVISLASIIGGFSLGAMGPAITAATARGKEGSLHESFIKTIRWSWIIIFIAGIGAAYYLLKGNYNLGIALLLIGSTSPLLIASSFYDSFLEGKQLFKIKSVTGFIRNGIPTIAVIVVVLFSKNLTLLFSVYFLSNMIMSVLVYRYVSRTYVKNLERDPSTLQYGFHLSIMTVLSTVANNLDKIIIFQTLGGAPLAVYSFAQAPIGYLQTAAQMLKTMILPRFAKRTIQDIKKTLPEKGLYLFLLSIFLAGAYYVLSPIFFSIFFPTYLESVGLSQMLVIVILFTPFILPGQALLAHSKTKELYVIRLVPPIFRAVLIILLIPPFGLLGAVYAIIGAKIFESLLVTIVFIFSRDQ